MSYDIEMTIEAVRDIANRTVESMKARAESTTRSFGDVELPPSAFGGWDEARALGRHHQGAHEVFVSTLQGVVTDLQEFAQNLRDSAASNEQRDEEVEASLLSLGRRYQDRTFRSQKNYTATVAAVTGHEGVDAGELAAQSETEAQAEAAVERGSGPEAGDPAIDTPSSDRAGEPSF